MKRYDKNEMVPVTRGEYAELVGLTKTLLKRFSQIGRFKRIKNEMVKYKSQLDTLTGKVNEREASGGIAGEIHEVGEALRMFSNHAPIPVEDQPVDVEEEPIEDESGTDRTDTERTQRPENTP